MPLIQEIQTEEWWENVTAPMLENVRKKLRDLVQLIEKASRKPIYTDFTDEMGTGSTIELPGFAGTAGDFEQFRMKRGHSSEIIKTTPRFTSSAPMPGYRHRTSTDLEEILVSNGVGSVEDIERAKTESQGLGVFIRSLVGLDREAAKQAFAGFLTGKTLAANQIEFVNMVINYLTEHGVMNAETLYESPFTDIAPTGPDGIFTSPQIDELMAILGNVQAMAMAA